MVRRVLVRIDLVRQHLVERVLVVIEVAYDSDVLTARSGLTATFAQLSPRLRVLTFAALLALGGATLLLVTPDATRPTSAAWTIPFFLLVVTFGVAEATALHVEIRKESHSLSLSGIPLLLGLLFSSPVMVVTAYVLGSAPTMLWIRRSDWVKTLWNSSLFMCEAALAALVMRAALGDQLPDTPVEWLVPLGAMLIAELMSLVAVPLVIMVVDAKFRPNLFGDVGRSQILAALAGTFTVTAAAAAVDQPAMIAYAVVPMLGVAALLQSTGHLSQRHKDLQQLHTFTRALTNERGRRTLDTGLVELVDIMRTRTAGLLIVSPDEVDRHSLRVLADESFADIEPDAIAATLVELVDDAGVTQLGHGDERPAVAELLERLGATKMLAVRVLREADHLGVLFVTDRLGMRSEFTVDELGLFNSLANTLSARLSNDLLVERLEEQARQDALTGLANRLSFEIGLTAALGRGRAGGAVVMVDLDRFKEINDSLGHDTGDRLLVEVARRLQRTTRASDMVARLGGDEFAVMLTQLDRDDPAELSRRLDDLHRALTAKVELDGITFELGASVGAVQWPEQGNDSAGLLHRADIAMYEAKRNQLGVVWYTPELDADAPRRLDLYMSVSAALERDEFFVHFQPKVSLADGRITGVEALVRWTHPAHGPVSPAEFIPLIVQAGLIGRLTRQVARRAAEAAAMFREAGFDVPVAVNLTARDLLDPTLVDDLGAILDRCRVQPSRFEVEITEDAMVVDFDTATAALRRLRAMGVTVSIDDFGTGYSSLQHLHRLPTDELKIDRSFVGRLLSDESAGSIVAASVNIARDLGLRTVAEGIEDLPTLRDVHRLGCDEIQGYLISRPLPALDLIRWATEWRPERLLAELPDPLAGDAPPPHDRVANTRARATEPAAHADTMRDAVHELALRLT